MKEKMGTTGLIFNEPLLWEKGSQGRKGMSLPRPDVEDVPLDEALIGEGPDFPDLSELDVEYIKKHKIPNDVVKNLAKEVYDTLMKEGEYDRAITVAEHYKL